MRNNTNRYRLLLILLAAGIGIGAALIRGRQRSERSDDSASLAVGGAPATGGKPVRADQRRPPSFVAPSHEQIPRRNLKLMRAGKMTLAESYNSEPRDREWAPAME